jgi:hypothetical protein
MPDPRFIAAVSSVALAATERRVWRNRIGVAERRTGAHNVQTADRPRLPPNAGLEGVEVGHDRAKCPLCETR